VRFTTGLGGFGVDTFDEVAKSAFRRALSVELSVSTTEISILNPVATTGRRRQLAASGVKFDVEVLAKSDAAAARIKSDVDTKVKAPEFKNKVKAELNAAWTHAGKTDAEKKALYNEDNFNAFDVAAATKPAAVGLATPTTTTEAPATTAAAATEDANSSLWGCRLASARRSFSRSVTSPATGRATRSKPSTVAVGGPRLYARLRRKWSAACLTIRQRPSYKCMAATISTSCHCLFS
jgi:hypothetical protein